MTLDKAIERAVWAAKNCDGERSEEYWQLANMLEELKTLREEHDQICSAKWEIIHELDRLKEENARLVIKLNAEHVARQNAEAGRDTWRCVAENEQDTIDHIERENKKLRDLVQMMYACKGECDECQWLNDGYACSYFMQDLGIEVDG